MARRKPETEPPVSETNPAKSETAAAVAETPAAVPETSGSDRIEVLQVVRIERNARNPRKHFDKQKMAELVKSVEERGVLQPILVRPLAERDGFFELVAGERRWRASQEAGRLTIPAVIREMSDDAAFEASVIENSHREDVNPIDEAESFAEYLKQSKDKDALERLARQIGHPVSYVRRRLVLTALDKSVSKEVLEGKMPLGTALVFARLPAHAQKQVLDTARRHGYSIRSMEWDLGRLGCELSRVPFDKSECVSCQNNGANEADLFGTGTMFKGSCLKPECYNRKLKEHVRAVEEKLAAEGREVADGKVYDQARNRNQAVRLNASEDSYFGDAVKMPRKAIQEKCLHCPSFKTCVSQTSGEVFEFCSDRKCAKKLRGKTKFSRSGDDDDAGEGQDEGHGASSASFLNGQRREHAQDFASAWLAKTWSETVFAAASHGQRCDMLNMALAKFTGFGRGSRAGSQLRDWMEIPRTKDCIDRGEAWLLTRLGAFGAYERFDLWKDKRIPVEVRKRAAATYPVTEEWVQQHLAANIRQIGKDLGLAKVPEKRGDAVKAILDAKLPAGTLTLELAKAFGVKYSKPKAASAPAKKTRDKAAKPEAAG